MASAQTSQVLLSPAELAYLHDSLCQTIPLRPDGRLPTQFRPLVAETGFLPGANGSARICFADGTEAVVGVKAEVEAEARTGLWNDGEENREGGEGNRGDANRGERGSDEWVEMTIEIPGLRDDDSGTVFLSSMMREALLVDGELTRRLRINRRFHWKLYLDVILISPPLSYPLPLLSLTTHLALLATRLPRLKSEGDEDPMFDDDWDASTFLYPLRSSPSNPKPASRTKTTIKVRPPITLLVMSVGPNIIFDPTKEELAVADCVLAISVAESSDPDVETDAMDLDVSSVVGQGQKNGRALRLLTIRTIDPPSRLTAPAVPNAVNAAAWEKPQGQGTQAGSKGISGAEKLASEGASLVMSDTADVEGVWKPQRGGAKWEVMGAMVGKVLERGGVADEVLDGLEGVELG